MSLDRYLGLTTESSDLFDDLVKIGEDIDDVLEFMDYQKSRLSKAKKHDEQPYLMLLIVEQVVRNFTRWSVNDNESELTFCRRFAALLDILLDASDIIMVDGEYTSEATKVAIDFNKTIFDLGDQSATFGRKINLIFKYGRGKQRVEISSNEWKRACVSDDVKTKQQCKNLRTNACILQQLSSTYPHDFNELVAMDFIGDIGYLCMLKKTKDDYYVAKIISKLLIPHNIANIALLKPTLDVMFRMKVTPPSS
ncbi:hypothetical protein DFQ30_004327 [Apophysomyces sp. BC1015]|nr:hypothetical protein DFQ30_004327 [Apophysomyces sp. BC1015]